MAFKLFGKPKPKRVSKYKKVVKKAAKRPIKKHVKKHAKRPVKKVVKKPAKALRHVKKVAKAVKKVEKPAKKIKAPIIEKMADDKAYEMFKSAKMPLLKFMFVKTEKDLQQLKKFPYPCMMKVSGTKIIHKTEVGGVMKVSSFEEVPEVFKRLMKIRGAEKILVQEFGEGFEMIVGAKADAQFGHIISAGIGGIYTELLKDVTFRVCPISSKDAEAMIKELKGYEILAGARGKKPINFDALYDILVRISNFVAKNQIKEMDINPLFCNEKGCFIGDLRIIK